VPYWKLTVEYDGTDFAGWQVQPDVRTVQGELARALSVVLRRDLRVTGAGRTDAGVHALGQVVSVDCDADVAGALRSINAVLPDDVVVTAAEPAPDGFHARRDAVRRHYRYRLHRGPLAVERRYWLELRPWPDAGRMREAAGCLPGSRDFASFCTGAVAGESTDCLLERVDIIEGDSTLTVEVTANRFLRKMVRTLVGTLLEVGWGNHPPEWIPQVLEARDRSAAGPVIGPQGLFLVRVDYPGFPGNGGFPR
jgi:tRNA pseudouridine38-40 synthase